MDYKLVSVPERKYKIWQSERENVFKFECEIDVEVRVARSNFLKNFGNKKNKIIISH
jgi:hypothetical protein